MFYPMGDCQSVSTDALQTIQGHAHGGVADCVDRRGESCLDRALEVGAQFLWLELADSAVFRILIRLEHPGCP